VLLAGVVTYFAINVTSTRVQEESLNLQYQHVWYNTGTGPGSEAAVSITNTGGRDVVINKMTVRGQTCPWANVYTPVTTPTGDLTFIPLAWLPSNTTYYTSAPTVGLTLKSGTTTVVYITSPDSITVDDVGLTIAISVFTAQATYYKETNVNAV
jgi:hypothetical protein